MIWNFEKIGMLSSDSSRGMSRKQGPMNKRNNLKRVILKDGVKGYSMIAVLEIADSMIECTSHAIIKLHDDL